MSGQRRLHHNGKDITGLRFSYLLVLRHTGERDKHGSLLWECECDCGTVVILTGARLRSENAQHCGCLTEARARRDTHAKDLTGQRRGWLTVLRRVGKHSARTNLWECRCDCGRVVQLGTHSLRTNRQTGCEECRPNVLDWTGKPRFKPLPEGEAAFNQLYNHYRVQARQRQLVWDLDQDFFRKVTGAPCYYCGVEPRQIHKAKVYHNGDYVYNGIDRVDSSVGYLESNCVPCCIICNRAKMQLPPEQFHEWLARIAARWAP